MFGLISKNKLMLRLQCIQELVEQTEEGLRNQWKEKECSEWSMYKQKWTIKGKLQLLNDLIIFIKIGEY